MLMAADAGSLCSCVPDGAGANHSPYWNITNPSDVNNDGFVAASDALAVINTLNSQGSHQLSADSEGEVGSRLFVDVNNDGYVAPSDALAVINQLNAEGDPPPQLVKYNLQPVDSSGTPITQVQTGGDFYLQLIGTDLRPDLFNRPDNNQDGDPDENLRGVYAAYMDILYENNLAAPAVSEVQSIVVPAGGTGSFSLTYPGFTTASGKQVAAGSTPSINFDQTNATTRGTTATAIATALNNLFGAGTVAVAASNATTYRVTYTKFLNTDVPEPTTGNANVTVTQFVSTNPADASYNNLAFPAAITYSTNYGNGKSGADGGLSSADNTKRIIDDVGAFWSAPTDAVFNLGPVEVLRIHMFAMLPAGTTDPQTVHFTESFGTTDPIVNPAPSGLIRPSHDTLVFGNLDATPPEQSCVGDDVLAFNPQTGVCPFTNGAQIQSVPGSLLITSGPIFANSFTAPAINEDSGQDSVDVITGHTGFNTGSGTIILQPGSAQLVSGQGTVSQNGNNVLFTPAPNFNGQAVISYKAQIQGDTDPSHLASAQVTIPVTAVNDKPTITAPTSVNMQENTPQVFSGTISIADVDFGETGTTNAEQVDLTVGQGTLTLGSTPAGLTVTGNNSAHVTISGTLTDINAALNGLTYTASDTPNASVSLQITANDNGNVGSGGAQTANATVGINITAQNDAPVNLLNGTAITNGDSIVAIPNQTFVFAGHGKTFSVADADAGPASLTTTLTLGGGATGKLHVDPTNGVTIGGNDSAAVTLQGSQTAITAALATLSFTPPNGSVAAETLTIATNDGGNTGAGGALTTTNNLNLVLDPGVRPFPLDDAFQFNEGVSGVQNLDVLANDFKAAGATTTIVNVTPVSPAAGGSVAIHAGGTSLDYTPPADTNFFTPGAPLTFTYTIHDDVAGSTDRTATVSIAIKNIPDNPVANPDGPYGAVFDSAAATQPQTVVSAANGVLANDTDVDNNYGVSNYATLSAVLVTPPSSGTFNLASDGSFTFTAAGPGDVTFTYKAHAITPDGSADSANQTVTIHVTTPPTATNDHFNVLEQGNPPTSGNVLTGAGSNPASQPDVDTSDGKSLTATLISNIPANLNAGSVTLNPDGSFTYNPPAGQNFNTTRPPVNDLTFTYQAVTSDGRHSHTATVSLTVQEVNDPPTATNDTYLAVRQRTGTQVGVDQQIDVLANDSILPDVAINGDEHLTVTGVSTSPNGPFTTSAVSTGAGNGASVRVDANGHVLYTSPTNAPATDTFYYQISDNSAVSRGGPLNAVGQVNINVVDFVPKTVSGTVFVDSNGDGVMNNGEHALSGVSVKLVGCDFTSPAGCDPNTNVIQTVTTDINGKYTFAGTGIGLAPPKDGTSFKVVEVQPDFLLTGIDVDGSTNIDTTTGLRIQQDTITNNNQFVLVWSVTDLSGDVQNLNFADGGIDARPLSQGGSLLDASLLKQEYLASTGANGFIFELDGSGHMLWSYELDPTGTAWSGTTGISAQISGHDGTTGGPNLLDFTVGGQTVTLGLNYLISGSTARFRVIGIGPSGQYIIRVDGSFGGSTASQPYDGMFANNLSGAGGEGESAPVNAEYAGAADAVFSEKSWA